MAKFVIMNYMEYNVIDVREPEEFASGHVRGAINIPLQQLMNGYGKLNSMSKDANLIVYCRTGSRSNMAKMILDRQGFKNVTNGINKQQVEIRYHL